MGGLDADGRDFFISHAGVDQQWAEWIGKQLTAAGYKVELDVWEWAPGSNFVAAMEAALRRAARIIAVYTPSYFTRPYAQFEHHAALVSQRENSLPRIVPVLVESCEIPDLYATLIRIELVGLDESEASRRLLDGLDYPTGPWKKSIQYPGLQPDGDGVAGRRKVDPGVIFPRQLPSISNMPPRNAFFTGRMEMLAQIHRKLTQGGRGVTVGVVPLFGIGGVGKTQIAVEYAHLYAANYSILWWVDAASSDLVTTSLVSLAGALGIPTEGPVLVVVEQLWMALQARSDWLMIFDNIDEAQVLSELRPPSSGNLLVTSRRSAVGRVADLIEVGEFDREESLALLRRRCPSLTAEEADAVATAVGDLPLAVEQASCFLGESGLPAVDYLRLLKRQPQTSGFDEPTLQRHPGLSDVVINGRSRVESLSAAAAELIDCVAFLAPEPLFLAPAETTYKEKGKSVQIGDAAATVRVVQILTGLGLARRVGAALQVHRLVQALLRARMTTGQRVSSYQKAQKLIATARPGDPKDPGTWSSYAAVTPHVQALSENHDSADGAPFPAPESTEPDPASFRVLLLDVSQYLYAAGRSATGAALIRQVNGHWVATLGSDHIDTLRLGNSLVANLNGLGQYAEARELAHNIFERARTVYGPDHAVTLESANELAGALDLSGDYGQARELHQDTLSRRKRVLGEDHPDTLLTAGNLVTALNKMGDYVVARDLAEENLIRCRRVLGEGNARTLYTASRLIISLNGLGDYIAARDIGTELLGRLRDALGEEHPRTLYTAARLAIALDGSGEVSSAREMLVDVLRKSRQILGEEHPETLWVKEELARL
ncbi:FxSxx-COOH system tetratricopeptide repeat protein [Frankia sp. R43]|uniref:FxSxx-COOH system tetratricopeptide repeat protein n=1 Tax=Frankia sp. R43 TaxID=269536 RepID=UPI000B2A2EB6|nr:FxSxx-COOH system tetratricopeptide repeat protein [Frankia sp. R43]